MTGETVPTPSRYPNPHRYDPWNNDAVRWLLEQPGAEGWRYEHLLRALRRQRSWLEHRSARVAAAEALASRHGVLQQEQIRGSSTIVRLKRTDPQAPPYPW